MPKEEVLTFEEVSQDLRTHPIDVVLYNDDDERVAEAEGDNIDSALFAAHVLLQETEDLVARIGIELKPGWRLLNGTLFYSSAWL